jgi:hypothetical protein
MPVTSFPIRRQFYSLAQNDDLPSLQKQTTGLNPVDVRVDGVRLCL